MMSREIVNGPSRLASSIGPDEREMTTKHTKGTKNYGFFFLNCGTTGRLV